MTELMWLIPAFPLISFLFLTLVGSRLSRHWVAASGVASVGLAMAMNLTFIFTSWESITTAPGINSILWRWIDVAGFSPAVGFHFDALTMVMFLVVTVVGFFIHLYSAEFMAGDERYSRFFAYMNLFVASMLVLVAADNLLLLYLGWEGVGLCSFLLIGFWHKEAGNRQAARKAFIITRIGDVGLMLGILWLWSRLGTLNIQTLLLQAELDWTVGSPVAVAAALLLLIGALGKSAQLPLQTWLPDAMAGPSPVSALIHAATMVTAGVYLIARTYTLFELAPSVQSIVAVIGAVTLLLAAFSALVQRDIKRVLAYSTISQIGYMFLALGIGAWSAAIFHLLTHAFFKALLFLAAGSVIMCLHHEHDIFKMGGLIKALPVSSWTFIIGGASLAGLPLVSAGFYSKELILWQVWLTGSLWLWIVGIAGAFLTALYTFRVIFIAFPGAQKHMFDQKPSLAVKLPLIVLAVGAVCIGFIELPKNWFSFHPFSKVLSSVFPAHSALSEHLVMEWILQFAATIVSLAGIGIAYIIYYREREFVVKLRQFSWTEQMRQFWFGGWGFDTVYSTVIVTPFKWLCRVNKSDLVDLPFRFIAGLADGLHIILSLTQVGRVRWYAAFILTGMIVILTVLLVL